MTSTDPASARALIDQIYAPTRQAINDQIAQSQAMAQARASQMQQVYGAFAQYMGGLQGNLQSIYQAGRADGNALASGMAGPGGAVADHLNTMAGIQNTMTDAEGKAWGDFGASMPGVYSLMATQNIKQMLNAAGADQQTLRNKLLDLSSQEASDILKYLDDAKSKDVQLSEWAYGQKQSQLSQFAAAQQNALNYDLKVAQYKFEQYQLALTHGDKMAQQQALNEYRAAELKYKYDSLAAQNTRAANSIAAANTRAANSLQFRRQQAMQKAGQLKPAPDAVSRSAGTVQLWNPTAHAYVTAVDQNGNPIRYKAAAGTAGSPAQIQKQLNAMLSGPVPKYIASLKKPQGTTTQNVYATDPKTGKIKTDSKGKPIVIGHRTVPGTGQPLDRKRLWRQTYNQFARQLFYYYRQLYPGEAKTKGLIQKRVDAAVTRAVGWGPNG
jgi:hypothetical protein